MIPLSTIDQWWQNISNAMTGRRQQVLTTTPLTANATYTSSSFDTLATTTSQINNVCAHAYADQDGTLTMLISMDNINWNHAQIIIPVNANTATIMPWQQPLDRYYKFTFTTVNTQTVFRLSTTSTTVN